MHGQGSVAVGSACPPLSQTLEITDNASRGSNAPASPMAERGHCCHSLDEPAVPHQTKKDKKEMAERPSVGRYKPLTYIFLAGMNIRSRAILVYLGSLIRVYLAEANGGTLFFRQERLQKKRVSHQRKCQSYRGLRRRRNMVYKSTGVLDLNPVRYY